ncbi:MAG: DNA repair protein RecN [Ruminococcaceae bacterium]|nr:DNA repair protein RecN [Oscillospiraceae bacterium]
MLKYLHIENIAVIEQSNIDFTNGFNLLTGETGAGKSIIIDAINAVLGERTSKELIRNGAEKATVCAQFDCLTEDVMNALSENGLSPDENGELYISRVLSLEGKGSIKINGIPVTAAVLREIGKLLITIHGQHDNQNLLNPDMHIFYVDRVAENEKLLDDYLQEYRRFKEIRKEIASLETDEDEKARKTDYLKFQINELETADIKVGEFDELKEKIAIARSFEHNLKLLSKATAVFSGSEGESGVIDGVDSVKNLLLSTKLKEYDNDISSLEEILLKIRDIASHIENFISNDEFSSENLDKMTERLDLLRRVMLKYGDSEEKLLQTLSEARAELDKITFSDERIEELEEQLSQSQERLIAKANALTASRQKAAKDFEKKVCEILSFLNMPDVKFVVEFKKGKYTRLGCDEVQFLISANAGENAKPLSKIASGGELSRVMLAIQNVLLNKNEVPTLIFDEIDAGISGRAADKVGNVLKNVAGSHQVICITHLAQIAANADTHFLIEKTTSGGRTFTNLTKLSYEGRIHELARIMSGADITENMYNSAKELLDRRS